MKPVGPDIWLRWLIYALFIITVLGGPLVAVSVRWWIGLLVSVTAFIPMASIVLAALWTDY